MHIRISTTCMKGRINERKFRVEQATNEERYKKERTNAWENSWVIYIAV